MPNYLQLTSKGVKEAIHTSDQIDQVFHTLTKIKLKVLRCIHTSETNWTVSSHLLWHPIIDQNNSQQSESCLSQFINWSLLTCVTPFGYIVSTL